MSDRTQIGPAVDAELWQQFREDVKARKGQVRGVLGDELENAIRQYLADDSSPAEKRIDQRLARIEDSLGVASADGGTDTIPDAEHTHAPSRVQSAADEKPEPNAATEKKVRYLAAELERDLGENFQQVPRKKLRDIVKEEYGFRSDTAKRYVAELVDHFDLVDHPTADPLLVSESERESILAEQREETAEESSDRLDELDTVTHE